MSPAHPIADWSGLRAEPDLPVPLPGGGALLLRFIPKGEFFMGSREGIPDEEPRHRVVMKDYFLGKFVVTQAEWRAVAATSAELVKKPGLDPSEQRNRGDRRPVTDVSWDDANAWIEALGAALSEEGKKELTARIGGEWHFRLPTEAEWEYACRAGAETDYSSGDGEAALAEVAWFGEDEKRGAHEVGGKAPNAAGLFDLHGNVWEWCRDVYRDGENIYRRRIDGDPAVEERLREGEETGKGDRQHRVMRGGSWGSSPGWCRSACRFWWRPGIRGRDQGFRLCLAPGPAAARQPEEQAEAKPGAADGGRGTSPESDAPGAAGAGGESDWSGVHLPAKPAEK